MQFEHCLEFLRAGCGIALVADALKLFAELLAVAVFARIGIIGHEHSGIDAGSEHRRGKARAFLIRPVDDHDRCVGFVAEIDHGAHRFERTEHAQDAVELAAGRLGIEMRAHGDRFERVVAPRPQRPTPARGAPRA